jgi:putative ABC transport system ATP-binding protein
LLNIIASLEQPTFGKVLFQGRNLEELTEDERSDFRRLNLGFVFQAFNLIPVFTAYENIEFALILKKVDPKERRDRVMESLRFVGLEDCAHRSPYKLSGGQQQRVAIARALAAEPKLILADEPTANLDSKTAVSILDLMQKELKKIGWTFACDNLPAAYLTGLLIGKRSLDKKITDAVLDSGLHTSVKGSRVYAVVKGAKDAGLNVPVNEEILPSEERIKGEHIAASEKFKNLPSEFGKILSIPREHTHTPDAPRCCSR